jgi:hypothetical protein
MPFEVEPSGEKLHECECCGGRSRTVWGYVHEEGGPTRALYYVGWTVGHDDKVVRMTVSLGAWGEGATADDRRAVAVDIRAPGGELWMGVVDGALFDDPDLLGLLLPRAEALEDPSLSDLWDVLDAVVGADPRVGEAMDWVASR